MRQGLFPSLSTRRLEVISVLKGLNSLRVGTLVIRTSVPVGGVDTVLFRLRVGNIVQILTKKICGLLEWGERGGKIAPSSGLLLALGLVL